MPETITDIAISAHSQRRYIMSDLAAVIQKRTGWRIHLYCTTPQEIEFYRNWNTKNVFASINLAAGLLLSVRESDLDKEKVIARARAFEQKLGTTLNMFAVGNRHLGRGYAPLGPYHPRSRHSEDTDNIQLLHAYSEELAFWEREIVEKQLGLIIGSNKELSEMARLRGIPFRNLAGSRYKNYHFWSPNEYMEDPELENHYLALDDTFDTAKIDEPYLVHKVARQNFLDGANLFSTVKKIALTTARFAYWRLRGYEKGRSYYWRDTVRSIWRGLIDTKRLMGKNAVKLDELHGQPFVFYALQTEPESSIGGLSPEFVFQHPAIIAASRDLPAGNILAVKEVYFAVGRRSPVFYDQVESLKNTRFVDLRENGVDVVRQSRAVVTINGTVGFEAAVMGKPVIALGRHNIYGFLPHVRTVTDIGDLRSHLAWALSDDFDAKKAKRDGARFLRAVIERSFDLGRYDHINLREYDHETVVGAADALLASLGEAWLEERAHNDAVVS